MGGKVAKMEPLHPVSPIVNSLYHWGSSVLAKKQTLVHFYKLNPTFYLNLTIYCVF